MKRLSFALPDETLKWLHREAKRLGISIGEMLRRFIDEKRTSER
jgi:hypothetical protein